MKILKEEIQFKMGTFQVCYVVFFIKQVTSVLHLALNFTDGKRKVDYTRLWNYILWAKQRPNPLICISVNKISNTLMTTQEWLLTAECKKRLF